MSSGGDHRTSVPSFHRFSSVGRCRARPADLAIELPLGKRHPYPIARVHRCGLADDTRAIGIPADRIAASKDGQWTERIQTAGAVPQTSISQMPAVGDRTAEPTIGGDQPRLKHAEAPPDVERIELMPESFETPNPSTDLRARVAP